MDNRYTPEANAAIEQLQAAGFDYAEADMIYHGDMLGSALGAKTAALITSLREALEPFAGYLDTAKHDLNSKGEPLSDEQGMGWVYLTVGDFRRARTALNPKERLDALLERARSNNPSRKETI